MDMLKGQLMQRFGQIQGSKDDSDQSSDEDESSSDEDGGYYNKSQGYAQQIHNQQVRAEAEKLRLEKEANAVKEKKLAATIDLANPTYCYDQLFESQSSSGNWTANQKALLFTFLSDV